MTVSPPVHARILGLAPGVAIAGQGGLVLYGQNLQANDTAFVVGPIYAPGDQLDKIARDLKRPLITGATPNAAREELFQRFRAGEERVLIVSKIANYAIDPRNGSWRG